MTNEAPIRPYRTVLQVSHEGGGTSEGWEAALAEWKRAMFAWHGLRPAPGDNWRRNAECPHWLTVSGHRRMRTHCKSWRSGLWDHPRAWTDADGRRVITLEPYFWDEESLAELTEKLAPLGITISVETDRSRCPYGSGHVIFLRGAR